MAKVNKTYTASEVLKSKVANGTYLASHLKKHNAYVVNRDGTVSMANGAKHLGAFSR